MTPLFFKPKHHKRWKLKSSLSLLFTMVSMWHLEIQTKKSVFCRKLRNMQSLVCSPSIWISSDHCFVFNLVGGQTGKQGPWAVGCYYHDLFKIWVGFYSPYDLITVRCYLNNNHLSICNGALDAMCICQYTRCFSDIILNYHMNPAR